MAIKAKEKNINPKKIRKNEFPRKKKKKCNYGCERKINIRKDSRSDTIKVGIRISCYLRRNMSTIYGLPSKLKNGN